VTAAPRARSAGENGGERGILALNGVTRRFGDYTAVDNVSFEVGAGELLALVGASGSGKTTTLRIAAGYEVPDSGTVTLGGRDITRVPPERRGFGMVFQHYALFPHMPVEENVAFGLAARGVNKVDRLIKARAALASVGLEGAGSRPIQSLSGGEQQRVALARAFVVKPALLFADEPTGSLDFATGETVMALMFELNREAGTTLVLVTHDSDIAARCDQQLRIEAGRIRA